MSQHYWTGHPIGDDDKRLQPKPRPKPRELVFIDLRQTGTDEEHPRASSLLIERDGSLRVVGNLPHGYTFKMKTATDARRLRLWLSRKKSVAKEVKEGGTDGR